MKKFLISILACSMLITGCSKKESKANNEKANEQIVVEAVESSTNELESLFEEDEYKDLKEDYNITDYKKVDESNTDSLLEKIDKAVKNNKSVIIAVGLGIVVIAGVAYVIYNPAIVTTLVTHLSTLMEKSTVKAAVKLLESGSLYSFIEYCKTGNVEKSLKKGANYTLNKIQKKVCDLI